MHLFWDDAEKLKTVAPTQVPGGSQAQVAQRPIARWRDHARRFRCLQCCDEITTPDGWSSWDIFAGSRKGL
jgi:hypothetical protein